MSTGSGGSNGEFIRELSWPTSTSTSLATASLHRSIMLQHGYSTPLLLKWRELEVASIQIEDSKSKGWPAGRSSVCTSCVCASACRRCLVGTE